MRACVRENIFGKCGGFLAVVYHIFLMWETVFDDRGPPGGLAGGCGVVYV